MLDFQCSPDVSLQALRSGFRAREGRQLLPESFPRVTDCYFSAPQTSPSKISSLAVFPSPRGPTVGGKIMAPRRQGQILVLSRRLPPGSWLWLCFRAPERANSSRWNHGPTASGTEFRHVFFLDLGFGCVSEPQRATVSCQQKSIFEAKMVPKMDPGGFQKRLHKTVGQLKRPKNASWGAPRAPLDDF